MRKLLVGFLLIALCNTTLSFAGEIEDAVRNAEEIFEATRITCSGISDEISKVSNISKANTAVTAVGTAASGGALAAGIAKSQQEKEIEALIDKMCKAGGCTAEGVEAMSDEDFFFKVSKLAFAHRRKTLWNNLQAVFGKTEEVRAQLTSSLEIAEISPQIRGEALSIPEFAKLSEALLPLK